MAYAKFHLGDGTDAKGERILTRASLDADADAAAGEAVHR